MNNLQEATERICELKGNVVALDALCTALLQQLAPPARERFRTTFEGWAEIARTAMLNAEISEHTIAAFENDATRIGALIDRLEHRQRPARDRSLSSLCSSISMRSGKCSLGSSISTCRLVAR